ncbi:MAG: glycosyltransferase, partial [Pseudomonadota bacterium]
MTKIPKNIFFIYLEGVHEIPVPLLNNIKEIDQNNPGWTVTIYDKKMAEEFIDREYGAKTLSTYKSINSQYYAARADFLRYLICHKYGGVYLDVKVQLDKPLGEILNCDDEFLLLQWDTQRASLGYGQWPELSHI